jgi:hypothetical protein
MTDHDYWNERQAHLRTMRKRYVHNCLADERLPLTFHQWEANGYPNNANNSADYSH